MKRSSIFVLLAGAAVAAPALAQTANVTLYGRLNMDVNVVSSTSSSDLSVNQVNSHGSRIGFMGNESLGGGNKALFLIESNVAADTGGGTLASREAYLGLQGDWGTVKLGRLWSVYESLYPIFGDNTLRNGIVTNSTLWANGATNSYKAGSFDAFYDNTVQYETPTLYGLNGMLQYNTAEDKDHSFGIGAGLFYKNAGFSGGIVYQDNDGYRAVDRNDQAISIALAYDFKVVKLAGVYEHMEYEVAPGHKKLKRDFYGASAKAPVGTGTLSLFYGYAADGKGTSGDRVGDVIAGSDTGAQQYSIAYSYPLSKRTTAYAGYIYIDNDNNARYSYFRGSPRTNFQSDTLPGVAQQGVTVGMAHLF